MSNYPPTHNGFVCRQLRLPCLANCLLWKHNSFWHKLQKSNWEEEWIQDIQCCHESHLPSFILASLQCFLFKLRGHSLGLVCCSFIHPCSHSTFSKHLLYGCCSIWGHKVQPLLSKGSSKGKDKLTAWCEGPQEQKGDWFQQKKHIKGVELFYQLKLLPSFQSYLYSVSWCRGWRSHITAFPSGFPLGSATGRPSRSLAELEKEGIYFLSVYCGLLLCFGFLYAAAP